MIDEEKLRGQEYLATHEEICDQALEHYGKLADECNHWFSTVPLAIKFYRRKAKIEAAIRAFEERAEDFLTANGCDLKGDFADLLRWVLGQEQETWTDKDFGLGGEKPIIIPPEKLPKPCVPSELDPRFSEPKKDKDFGLEKEEEEK